MSKEIVIITAGGKGLRMGSETPKQFIELNGLPVILHTINAFAKYSRNIQIVLILPEDHMDEWQQLTEKYSIDIDYRICAGGETRFDSVKNGLQMLDDEGLVAIHDAVRPLASVSLISACYLLAAEKGNAIPVIPLQDSIREVHGDESRPIDREKFRSVQTPQVFELGLIKKAYQQAFRTSFTDDATVAEAFGAKINTLEGEKKNIKITTPEDLAFAEAQLKA